MNFQDHAELHKRVWQIPRTASPKLLRPPGAKPVTIPTIPHRIVATNTGAADILSALADPADIAAVPYQVDEYSASAGFWSTHPEIKHFEKFQAETILAFKPDLIVASVLQDAGTAAALERLKIPILYLKDYGSFEDIRSAISTIGAAIGEEKIASNRIVEFDARLKQIADRIKTQEKVSALIYSNFGTGYTLTAGTCQHDLLEAAGAEDAAAKAGMKGLAPITFEQVLRMDPDWLVIAGDNGLDSPQARVVLNEPALQGLRAVKARRIAVVPARNFDALSQFMVEAVESLANQLHPISSRPTNIPLH